MTIELAVALVACALTFLTVVSSAVWVVAKINGTTESLRATIEHLAASIHDVKSWLNEVSRKQNAHGERIARLEVRQDVCDEAEE